jgi:hypothetical protein
MILFMYLSPAFKNKSFIKLNAFTILFDKLFKFTSFCDLLLILNLVKVNDDQYGISITQ